MDEGKTTCLDEVSGDLIEMFQNRFRGMRTSKGGSSRESEDVNVTLLDCEFAPKGCPAGSKRVCKTRN